MNLKTPAKSASSSCPKLISATSWALTATIFVVIHCTIEPLFTTMLITVLLGLFVALVLYGFLCILLLIKNRSFWHNAVIDDDPAVLLSTRLLCALLAVVYVAILAGQIFNSA